MTESKHATGRGDSTGEADSTKPLPVEAQLDRPLRPERDAEFERQLEIARGVQRDFKEVLAALAK